MGADSSKQLEEQQLDASRAQQHAQPQQQSRRQPQPQPQSQPQQRPQPQPKLRQQQQQQSPPSQPQQQQQQPESHERNSGGAWLLPPQVVEVKPSTSSAKLVENTRVVKPSATQITRSLTPVKPLKQLTFPHNYQDILKDADSPVDKSSREKLCDQLYAGVFLDHKTKRYWLEKKFNANCFMLYARALSISWAENQNYWKWVPQKEASGTLIEVAELKIVCWLEVHGKFDTRKLSPGIPYEVLFLVMLKDPAQGWEVPVNVRLVLPGGKKQERKENLIEKLRMCWIEIPVGEFVASAQDVGDMEFSMYEYEGGVWKQGLVIKGVAIKPKNKDTDNYSL